MTLPSFLQRTPEQIRDEQARQQILRDLHLKGARQTPAEMRIGQAILAEKAIRANLEQITPDMPNAGTVMRETRLQLAEALAEQGKFNEAAAASVGIDGEFERYMAMAHALERPDDEFCDCPEDGVQARNAQGAVTIPVPTRFVAAEVIRDGKIIPLVMCAKCGHANATELHDPTNGLAAIETDRNEAFAR